jgi:hypothetical protein
MLFVVIVSLTGMDGQLCASDDEVVIPQTRESVAEDFRQTLSTWVMAAAVTAEEPEPARAMKINPYAEWDQWCEPLDYDLPCKTHDDCSDIQHVSRRSLRCVHPYWAKGDPDYKICAPGYSSRQERVWREARLRELVAQAYFAEAEHCADWSWRPIRSKKGNVLRYERIFANGRPTHRQFWKCTQRQARAQKLTLYLNIVYSRETSKRPWKRHRLDVEPNREAWIREAGAYGWKIDLACRNGRKRCKKSKLWAKHVYPDPEATVRNPHFEERWRWRYGLGGYGKNAAYGTQDWDPLAPPEILCLEVPGTEAYLRDAREAVRTYTSARPPTCNGVPYRGQAVDPETGEVMEHPSWVDVHEVASGGRWCPRPSKRKKFKARAIKAGLDPDEPVTLTMLGDSLPREEQNRIAQRILTRLERVLPPPWAQQARKPEG